MPESGSSSPLHLIAAYQGTGIGLLAFEVWLGTAPGWIGSLCLLGTVSAALYLPSLDGEFLYDDAPAVYQNPDVTADQIVLSEVWFHDFWGNPVDSTGSNKSWRPIATIVFRHLFWSETHYVCLDNKLSTFHESPTLCL